MKGVLAAMKAQMVLGASGPSVPDWLLQLVRAEVTPLISAVAASVLGSLGCTSIPGSAASSSGGTSSTSSSSSSSSSSKPSQRATATSAAPLMAAQRLLKTIGMLGAIGQLHMVFAQLLEAVVRAWQQRELHMFTLAELQKMLEDVMRAILRSTISSSNSNASNSLSSLSRRGPLLEAAQVQGHTTDSDPLTPEQLQLASLCCSVLKVLPAAAEADPSLLNTRAVLQSCRTVAEAACFMLHWMTAGGAGAESAAGSSSAQQAVVPTVPWLVLCGRVLQFVAPRMMAAAAIQQRTAERLASLGSSSSSELLQSASSVISGLRVWLQHEGAADALSAAGYDPSGSLLQQLQAVCGAAHPLQLLEPETQQSLGATFSSLPFACACNNPACTNLAGPREQQLVNGKSCLCAGCRVARYCSRACQVQHWPAHKPVCKAAAAVQKAASAAAAQPPSPAP